MMDLRFKPQYMARHVEVERTVATPEDRTLVAETGNVVRLQDPNAPNGVPASKARL